jgi:pre-rRNA-processing protein TSR1
MPASVDSHHHRSTTKQSHKAFKPRFTSKGALKDKAKGKVESLETGTRRTPHQQVMNKLGRRNQAKQKRIVKGQTHTQATTVFAGKDGAPRVVAVIPLCDDVDLGAAVRTLNSSIDVEDESIPSVGLHHVRVDRFKQRLAYMMVEKKLFAALDACRAADYVLFILSAEEEVDEVGEEILRCVEGQGVSNVYTAVQGIDKVEPAKRRPQVLGSLKSFITHFFATQEKVFSIDSRQECQNVVRSLCTTLPKGVRWREDRSWMLVEEFSFGPQQSDDANTTGECIISGVVRGKSLKADRLVQVGDWGDFQIEKIVAAPRRETKKGKEAENVMDIDAEVDLPTEDCDDLDEMAPEDTVEQDADTMAAVSTMASERKGVLLDNHHYYSEDEDQQDEAAPKRIPRGTSRYQAAWYLNDMSDSGSDLEDAEYDDEDDMAMTDTPAAPADGIEGLRPPPETEGGAPSEYPQSEFFDDVSPNEEASNIAAYRDSKRKEAADDLLFPDEIELQPSVLARERLHKYRGLKSLRTSPWDTTEDALHQPDHWARLLDIRDYKGARSRVLRDSLTGGIRPGTRVSVHLRNVPLKYATSDRAQPLALYSHLRHEHKRTAVNFSITLDSEYPEPLKSKEEIVVQCGPRRFVVNPLFSLPGNTANDVHKFERFLHPGRTAVASWIGPVIWGSVPTLFFKRSVEADNDNDNDDNDDTMALDTPDNTATTTTSKAKLTLIGHGTSLPASTTRIIAKRIVLTGEPYKINKKVVTIRYMFFNAEDVAWFKALQLWTNHGRQGQIKESLGTHGYFKAGFDGKINPQEGVGVSLYKRVWPRWARMLEVGEMS